MIDLDKLARAKHDHPLPALAKTIEGLRELVFDVEMPEHVAVLAIELLPKLEALKLSIELERSVALTQPETKT